jgi:hypothetical protein
LAVLRKVEYLLAGLGVIDHGSYRNRHFHGAAVATGPLAAFAMATALARVLGVKTQMEQGAVVLARQQHNFAAMAAVTAAGAAARDKFFAPERQTTVAAVSGFNGNRYFVYEHWES